MVAVTIHLLDSVLQVKKAMLFGASAIIILALNPKIVKEVCDKASFH